MTTTPSQSAPNLPPKRRGWSVRLFYQFSLRTLLVVMTLAAVVCWWLSRPQFNDEKLAGDYLTLRRQVKNLPADQVHPTRRAQYGEVAIAANAGSWQLRNEFGDLVVAGRYQGDVPQGKWTIWHANGYKATEGHVIGGARTGAWRVWDEEGRLRSEVTYRVVAKNMAEFVPGESKDWVPAYVSERQGPAQTWWPGGQLRSTGAYADDKRSGTWTWFDERGQVREATY